MRNADEGVLAMDFARRPSTVSVAPPCRMKTAPFALEVKVAVHVFPALHSFASPLETHVPVDFHLPAGT